MPVLSADGILGALQNASLQRAIEGDLTAWLADAGSGCCRVLLRSAVNENTGLETLLSRRLQPTSVLLLRGEAQLADAARLPPTAGALFTATASSLATVLAASLSGVAAASGVQLSALLPTIDASTVLVLDGGSGGASTSSGVPLAAIVGGALGALAVGACAGGAAYALRARRGKSAARAALRGTSVVPTGVGTRENSHGVNPMV